MNQVQNSAQMVVFMSQGNDATAQVIADGVDPACVHHYAESSTVKGEYIGTRFSDGSAVSASGHTRQPVEFLGTFHNERAPKDWEGVEA